MWKMLQLVYDAGIRTQNLGLLPLPQGQGFRPVDM